MSAYANYWRVGNALTILQLLTLVVTLSLILVISTTWTSVCGESTHFDRAGSCLIMYLRAFYVRSIDFSIFVEFTHATPD